VDAVAVAVGRAAVAFEGRGLGVWWGADVYAVREGGGSGRAEAFCCEGRAGERGLVSLVVAEGSFGG
jgi:hypothetical protein